MPGSMVRGANYCCFFFSSRRRHTRLQGDWSSDVCSSDLVKPEGTMMSSPLPGSKKTFSPEQSGFVTSAMTRDRKSTRLNSSHLVISYAVFCLKKKKKKKNRKYELHHLP